MGYVSTGETTGWPLFTPRYDGAIVAGLYARDPDLAGGRQAIAAIPNWSTLTVGGGRRDLHADHRGQPHHATTGRPSTCAAVCSARL